MNRTALFVGDVSWDTTVFASRLPEPDEKVVVDICLDAVGGVAANSAAACALAGAEVILASSVGGDAMGGAVRTELERLGLSLRIETTEGATARAVILLDGDGEKRLFLYQGDRMYPSAALIEQLAMDGVGWMHTALYDHEVARRAIARCRELSIPWSIDLESATLPADISLLAPHLDGCAVVIVNNRSAAMLGSDAVERLRALGARTVIETLGPGGVRVHDPVGAVVLVEPAPLRAPVRDTTGAGDAFAGWLIAELLRGASLHEAARVAVAAASRSVQSIGTIASYPTRQTLVTEHATIRERPIH